MASLLGIVMVTLGIYSAFGGTWTLRDMISTDGVPTLELQ